MYQMTLQWFCIIRVFVYVFNVYYKHFTDPVAERSKASVYGRSPAGIAGSNPAEGMDIYLLWVYCVWQVEVSATDWSLVQRSPTDSGVSLCVI